MPWTTVGNIRGPQGPQGIPGPVGPAGLTWRGSWSAANTYAKDDAVGWGGSSYYATAARAAGTSPPTGTADNPGPDDAAVNAGWALLATQGAQGPQGAPGNDGAPGVAGTRGSKWYVGTGAPGVIAGSLPDDQYLDQSTGDVYTLT